MRNFIVASDSYIADRLVGAGSRITDEWLAPGTEPGDNLIETDEVGAPLDPADTARLLAVGVSLGPVQVAPVMPHAPNPTRPQSLPAQPAGSVQIAGDREYVPADGVESHDAAKARVESLERELEVARSAVKAAVGVEPARPAPTPEPPLRRATGTTGTTGVAAGEAVGTAAGEAAAAEPGPLDTSVPELETHLQSVDDPAELQRLRDAEVAGKSRSTAIKAIDDRFAELNA